MADDDAVSFIFGLHINWTILSEKVEREKVMVEAKKEEDAKALRELNEKRQREKEKKKHIIEKNECKEIENECPEATVTVATSSSDNTLMANNDECVSMKPKKLRTQSTSSSSSSSLVTKQVKVTVLENESKNSTPEIKNITKKKRMIIDDDNDDVLADAAPTTILQERQPLSEINPSLEIDPTDSSKSQSFSQEDVVWECHICTYMNDENDPLACAMCNAARRRKPLIRVKKHKNMI